MNASHEWDEWHLTPRGWIAGSTKVDFEGILERAIPRDRVLTVRYIEHIASAHGPLRLFVAPVWSCDDEVLIVRLKNEFGADPSDAYAQYNH